MRFIKAAMPVLEGMRKVFKEGLRIAKALAQICIAGIIATTALITELPKLLAEQEPP